jgi:hypothetical protein
MQKHLSTSGELHSNILPHMATKVHGPLLLFRLITLINKGLQQASIHEIQSASNTESIQAQKKYSTFFQLNLH